MLNNFTIEGYFRKIADPRDIASIAGVSFTVNHIAAVFPMGAVMLARLVPAKPTDGSETRFAQ